jgi:hypothetical protein
MCVSTVFLSLAIVDEKANPSFVGEGDINVTPFIGANVFNDIEI